MTTREEALEQAANRAQQVVDEVRRVLDAGDSSDLAERSRMVRAKLAEAEDALAAAATEAGDTLRPVMAEVQQDFASEIKAVEEKVRENPLGALLAAAGVGVLLGLAFSQGRRGARDV